MEIDIIELDEVSSTNDYIRTIEKRHATIVSCAWQHAGRGQKGNVWESEKGANLLFSLYVKPCFLDCRDHFYISKIVSLSVVDTLSKYGIEAQIKWPNDIYVGDKKISGILIENSMMSGGTIKDSIIGIGLNVNQSVFIGDAPNPVSMSLIKTDIYDTKEVMKSFADSFVLLYGILERDEFDYIDDRYKKLLYRIGRWHTYYDTEYFVGKIVDVAPCGELLIEKKDGTRREYLFKQIKFCF